MFARHNRILAPWEAEERTARAVARHWQQYGAELRRTYGDR